MSPAPTRARARVRASFVGSTSHLPLAPRFDSLKLRFERTNFVGRIASANLELLRQDGFTVLEPEDGWQACRRTGPGRLPEPETLLARLESAMLSD